jgi:hypothetical protein
MKPAKMRDLYIMEAGGDEGDEDVDGEDFSSSESAICSECWNWEVAVAADMMM